MHGGRCGVRGAGLERMQQVSGHEPLSAVVSPAIPLNVQEVPNQAARPVRRSPDAAVPTGQPRPAPVPCVAGVLRRQFACHLAPAAAGRSGPAAPDAPDDRKFDFSVIDDALAKLAGQNMRLTLRVVAYNSCCNSWYPNNTNIAIPDFMWPLAANYTGPQRYWWTTGVTHVVPNWNDPQYLDAFGQLLAALGRRYDGDERLSVFEFSGYGDFSENHISYQRDTLGAPGPAPDESVAKLGYYSQFRDQTITAASIRQLVAAHVSAFPIPNW